MNVRFVFTLFALGGGGFGGLQSAAAQTDSVKSQQELLSDLRGLYLPEDPSWWPPAPGWWVVFLLCLMALLLILKLVKGRRGEVEGSWQSSALLQHARLKSVFESGAPLNDVLSQCSVLMRKVALARLPRDRSASVQNDAWLQLLDEIGGTDQYSNGPGRLLLNHPYQKQIDLERGQVAGLLDLMRTTIVNARGDTGDV